MSIEMWYEFHIIILFFIDILILRVLEINAKKLSIVGPPFVHWNNLKTTKYYMDVINGHLKLLELII